MRTWMLRKQQIVTKTSYLSLRAQERIIRMSKYRIWRKKVSHEKITSLRA